MTMLIPRKVADQFPVFVLCCHIVFIFGCFSSFASAEGASLILYNRKFKTNFRDDYKYGWGREAPYRYGNAVEFWRLSQHLRWMIFWLRRRLTASNSSLEKSRG
jgi:hypothetical protein